MRKLLLPFLLFSSPIIALSQQVSTLNYYSYSEWKISKGDTIKIAEPSNKNSFSAIYDTPTDFNRKTFLNGSAEHSALIVKFIKKYKWGNDNQEVYLVCDYKGERYFINIDDAVYLNEVQLPEGVTKKKIEPKEVDDRKSYVASNGITYRVGDNIELGKGSGHNGQFIYLHVSGWGAVIGAKDYVGSSYAGQNVILKNIKIEKNKKIGYEKVLMLVGGGNITDYSLEIEQAISSCEVIPCKNKSESNISISDELNKLKKLKDDGILTDDEFKMQKEKLLNR